MTESHHPQKVEPPDDGSSSAEEFFRGSQNDFGLFSFVIELVLTADYTAYVATKSLVIDHWKVIPNPTELAARSPGAHIQYLRRNRQALLEIFLGRAIDNFQRYLANVIREVLRRTPAMLKSRQSTISLEEVLQFDSLDELVRHIIESKVNALSYEGFRELQRWCSEKGIPLMIPYGKEAQLAEAIATRNLIAHNRGVVDQKYLRAVSTPRFRAGETRSLEVDDLFETLKVLHEVVQATDHAVVGKFDLTRVPIRQAILDAAKAEGESPSETTKTI